MKIIKSTNYLTLSKGRVPKPILHVGHPRFALVLAFSTMYKYMQLLQTVACKRSSVTISFKKELQSE